MLSEVDVFISNYTLVDPEIYQLWVDGFSSSEAVNTLNQRGICQQTNAPIELVASDVLDHYRTYSLLERLLQMPLQLACEQLAFQIEPQTSQMLIEMFVQQTNFLLRSFGGTSRFSFANPNALRRFMTLESKSDDKTFGLLNIVTQLAENYTLWIQIAGVELERNQRTPSSAATNFHVFLYSRTPFIRPPINRGFALTEVHARTIRKSSDKTYYEFDDAVVRDFLGKKLSAKHRKELDEVAEKTGVSLKSCRRQFDNVKRVLKVIEDLPGSLAANIKQYFLLPEELAKRYAAVVFIACMRFEMNKKKLQYLTFPDLYHCANTMMALWTYRYTGSEYFDTDLDREFLLDLPECRVLLENDKHHKHLVCIKLKPTLLERSYQELDMNFRSYSRAIIGIACNLHRSRELRSFFLELVERCLEPWRQVNWSHTDLRNFLAAYTQCALDMDVLREADLKNAFDRYMKVVTSCLLRMYRA